MWREKIYVNDTHDRLKFVFMPDQYSSDITVPLLIGRYFVGKLPPSKKKTLQRWYTVCQKLDKRTGTTLDGMRQSVLR